MGSALYWEGGGGVHVFVTLSPLLLPPTTHSLTLTNMYIHVISLQYLSTPDSLHHIPELIRFICCVIHPTNEVFASDIIPRWALIGWLLSLCQSNLVVFNNAKLALFYDWLAYNPDSDNIMNIGTYIYTLYMYMYIIDA